MNPGDLPTAISLLRELTLFAESTIESVSSCFLGSSTEKATAWGDPDSSLCACPYDPRHRLPPESLFRHSLLCPSSPGSALLDLGFLDPLRYPNSLKSQSQLQNENHFVASPLLHESGDLCFSLDDDGACESVDSSSSSNFFYKGCPGVVAVSKREPEAKTFLLPANLAAECANFKEIDGGAAPGASHVCASGGEIGILPSGFWALKCETEAWKDYPATYSNTALRVASCLDKVDDCGLKRWIVSNSPRFGVVIDAAMCCHVFLLFKLCLTAIQAEAQSSFRLLLGGEVSISDVKSKSFGSSNLVQSLVWLASQLSVLCGEANGKLFIVEMLRESFLGVGRSLILFMDQSKNRQDDFQSMGEADTNSKDCEWSRSKSDGGVQLENNRKYDDVGGVFVSQVAAAVAALHERLMFEQRIRDLRFPRVLPRSQRVLEYENASKKACQIRENRPNYRAVPDYDGLLWQRGNKQDSGKTKTREGLLAEERDYKRRRLSYRGKKVKRNATEVLRDIIEEHMDEIRTAGGIYSDVKSTSGHPSHGIIDDDRTARNHAFQSNENDRTKVKQLLLGHSRPPHFDSNNRLNNVKDLLYPKRDPRSEQYEIHKQRKYKKEDSEISSPPISRDHDNFHDQFTYCNGQHSTGVHSPKSKNNISSENSFCRDDMRRSTLESANGIKNQGHKFASETRSLSRGRTETSKSKSLTATGFEDRYNPSNSYHKS